MGSFCWRHYVSLITVCKIYYIYFMTLTASEHDKKYYNVDVTEIEENSLKAVWSKICGYV